MTCATLLALVRSPVTSTNLLSAEPPWRACVSNPMAVSPRASSARTTAAPRNPLLPVTMTRIRWPPVLEIEDDEPLLGHLFDGVARPLAAAAARLYAAVSELVGAPGRTAVDDHAADPQAADRGERDLVGSGENAGLQPVGAGIDCGKGVGRRLVRDHVDHGTEYLFADHFHFRLEVRQQGRLVSRTMPMAPNCDARTGDDGLLDPSLHPPRGGFVDERADIGRRIERIAELHLAYLGLHQSEKGVG